MIDREILEMLEVYIQIQNIQLLKYIAQSYAALAKISMQK